MKRACGAHRKTNLSTDEIAEIVLAFVRDGAVELIHLNLEDRILLAPLLELLIEARRASRLWVDHDWELATTGALNLREILSKTPFIPDATHPDGSQLEYLFSLVAIAKIARAACENSQQHWEVKSQLRWLFRKFVSGDYELILPNLEAAVTAGNKAITKLGQLWNKND
jgi:hypothetical protein